MIVFVSLEVNFFGWARNSDNAIGQRENIALKRRQGRSGLIFKRRGRLIGIEGAESTS
jgi:hypothetical protein